MNGYFYILKGVNECGIEADINAGEPKESTISQKKLSMVENIN